MDLKCVSALSGPDYIHAMFANTQPDGKLVLQEDDYVEEFYLDWSQADAQTLAADLEALLAALTRLAKEFAHAGQASDLPEELQPVWNTYIRPYPDHGMDQEVVQELLLKEELEDELTQQEQQMLDRQRQWLRENAASRLPIVRNHPVNLIQRARRFWRLLELGAPKIILDNEEHCLAEELAKYRHKVPMHTCRCCGQIYSLLPTEGYDIGSICPTCRWEEDWLDDSGYSCANRTTLEEYRREHGIQACQGSLPMV